MEFQTVEEVYKELKNGLVKVQDHLENEYASLRAGRANPKILDRVMVNYYGSLTPLNQMANIEPRKNKDGKITSYTAKILNGWKRMLSS